MASPKQAPEPAAVAVEGADTLEALEERITRAVELVIDLRAEKETLEGKLRSAVTERDEALRQAEAAQAEAAEARANLEHTAGELDSLRSERKQVRTRIEKLLGQMDLLSEV